MLYLRSIYRFILISLALLGFSISSANASVVYNVDRTIGDGTVIGFIETDGTLGALVASNIDDWEFVLTAPALQGGSPDTINMATQIQTTVIGTLLTATATQLIFDYSILAGALLFQGSSPDNFWCLNSSLSFACSAGSVELMGFPIGTESVSRSGQVVIAEISVIPIPAAVWLFGTALIGLIGFGRRRKAA